MVWESVFYYYIKSKVDTKKYSPLFFPIHSPWKPHSILSRHSRDAFSGDEITDYCALGVTAFWSVLGTVDC